MNLLLIILLPQPEVYHGNRRVDATVPVGQPPSDLKDPKNMGIGPRENFADKPKWSLQGRPVSEELAHQLVGTPELPDDRGKPWLVYVGKDKDEASKAGALLAKV